MPKLIINSSYDCPSDILIHLTGTRKPRFICFNYSFSDTPNLWNIFLYQTNNDYNLPTVISSKLYNKTNRKYFKASVEKWRRSL